MTTKAVRKRLVTLLDADSTFNLVVGYKPMTLAAVTTKVLAVYTRDDEPEWLSADMTNRFHGFYLDCLVKRDDETSEDALNDMHDAVESVLRANVGDVNWSALSFDGPATASFTEISGVPYRLQRHSLLVKVTS